MNTRAVRAKRGCTRRGPWSGTPWQKGVRIGIIASSDHGQTHQARAGVYVQAGEDAQDRDGDGFTRRGILLALKARRAYGATTAVAMQVHIGDRPLGREITVRDAPTLKAAITAVEPITRLEVVKNNTLVYSAIPKKRSAQIDFTDLELDAGDEAYYYVRTLIGEKDVAWSSPIWVKRER